MSHTGTLSPAPYFSLRRWGEHPVLVGVDSAWYPTLCFADKDRGHVIGGLKAAITNPRTSPEAKESAAERLRELEEPVHHELGSHQISGYKATISSS